MRNNESITMSQDEPMKYKEGNVHNILSTSSSHRAPPTSLPIREYSNNFFAPNKLSQATDEENNLDINTRFRSFSVSSGSSSSNYTLPPHKSNSVGTSPTSEYDQTCEFENKINEYQDDNNKDIYSNIQELFITNNNKEKMENFDTNMADIDEIETKNIINKEHLNTNNDCFMIINESENNLKIKNISENLTSTFKSI